MAVTVPVIGSSGWGTVLNTALTYLDTNKEPSFGAGTTSQYLRGDKTWQALNKAAVGLSAVDNTADNSKPVSVAQSNAINAVATSLSASINSKPNVNFYPVNTSAAMTALTGAVRGDIAIRADMNGQMFILSSADPTDEANWLDLITGVSATDVDLSPPTGMAATDVQAGFAEIQTKAGSAGFVADSTSKSVSNITLSSDTALAVPILAGETMWLVWHLTFSGNNTGTVNMNAGLAVPSGATGTWGSQLDYEASGSSGTAKGTLATLSQQRTFKLNGTPPTGVLIRATVVNGTNAGNVTLQWAQNTLDAANPLIRDAWGKVTWEKGS